MDIKSPKQNSTRARFLKFICTVCAILSSVLHVHLHPLLTLELDLIIIPTAKQATTALGNAADTFVRRS